MDDVAIIGIAQHPFGRFGDKSALDMGLDSIREALKDAGIEWKDVQYAAGGTRDGGRADQLCGKLGPNGVPFNNLYNGCATGGSSLGAACMAIKSGIADIALAVGFDKHPRGMFLTTVQDYGLKQWYQDIGFLATVQFFAMKAQRYMYDYGITEDSLYRVAEKNYYNGTLNPKAWRRDGLKYEEIAASKMLSNPLRQYTLCSPGEGAAAIVMCKASIAKRYTTKPIYIKGIALRTRQFGSLEVFTPAKPLDDAPTPVVLASQAAYKMAGIGPDEIQVAQLQDTEAAHEIMHMAETGLCKDGEQTKMIKDGETQITGRLPVNTDGGLIANGEPIGASALRQIYEVCLQMRGDAGAHQMPTPPKTALTQVYGAPGISNVVILSK
ncbi:MAG TPA: thiolase family protein [Syntrophomonas sp.]|nr:thiolase family protein [Syntrophomonas sp.]